MAEKRPAERIREQYELRAEWSDEAILAELEALPVLPDEYNEESSIPHDDSHWMDPEIYQRLMIYIALADHVDVRKLRAGVPLLLERASYGDMGETMRGLRHTLEGAYNPDWVALNDVCVQMAQSPYRGCRLWSVEELGRIRDVRSLPTLINALHDSAKLVRDEAVSSLERLCQTLPEIRAQVIQALQAYLSDPLADQIDIQETIKSIQEMDEDSSD